MSKIAVVINHWGGVPVALQANLVASQEWKQSTFDSLEVPNLDPILSFRSVAATSGEGIDEVCLQTNPPTPLPLFDALHRTGVQIIVLGATGLRRHKKDPYAVRHEMNLPDSREDLHDWGIDRCSIHDSADQATNAILHDEEVILEARRLLMEDLGGPTLLWVNLLSCRDVNHCRFRPRTGRATQPSYSGVALASVDERLIPHNLRVGLEDLSYLAASADATAFGESVTAPNEIFIQPGEYLRLLEDAKDTLLRLDAWTQLLIKDAETAGASVAMTATHANSLGEHGTRKVLIPTEMSCNTFWCSTIVADRSNNSKSLASVVDDFLHHVFGVAPRRARKNSCTLGTISHGNLGVILARTTCRWNDRRYSCIAKWMFDGSGRISLLPLSLTHVFDLDIDPFETTNILPQIAHIYTQLLEDMELCIPKSVLVSHSHNSQPPPPTTNNRRTIPPPKSASSTIAAPAPERKPTAVQPPPPSENNNEPSQEVTTKDPIAPSFNLYRQPSASRRVASPRRTSVPQISSTQPDTEMTTTTTKPKDESKSKTIPGQLRRKESELHKRHR